MTEEIIIDGVDVSECEYSGNVYCYKDYNLYCKDEINCYYKQLQRLKQENEKLKEELKQLKDDIATETMCIQCKTAFEKCKIYADIEGLRIDVARAKMKAKNFRKALEDIREIAQYEINELTDSAIQGGRYLEILDKINEVLK